jgi:hypothetical protein
MISDFVSLLFRAPQRTRTIIATALAVAVATMLLGAVWSVISLAAQGQRDVSHRRELLGRLSAMVARKGVLLHEIELDRASIDNADFLPGESEALARGNLQAAIGELVTARGANVVSVSNLPDMASEGMQYVGARADLSGTFEAVYRAIAAIEASRPIIIRELKMSASGADDLSNASEPPVIFVELQVFAAIKSSVARNDTGASP